MASWGEVYENPFTPVSAEAAKAFGHWMRRLVDTRQPGIREIVLSRREFLFEMDGRLNLLPKGAAVTDEASDALIAARKEHYRLRPGVDEVVFMQREHARARFLLPEPDAIGRFDYGDAHEVDMPTCYVEHVALAQKQLAEMPQSVRDSYVGKASYPYTVKRADYEAFLDPFLAAYTCTQCA